MRRTVTLLTATLSLLALLALAPGASAQIQEHVEVMITEPLEENREFKAGQNISVLACYGDVAQSNPADCDDLSLDGDAEVRVQRYSPDSQKFFTQDTYTVSQPGTNAFTFTIPANDTEDWPDARYLIGVNLIRDASVGTESGLGFTSFRINGTEENFTIASWEIEDKSQGEVLYIGSALVAFAVAAVRRWTFASFAGFFGVLDAVIEGEGPLGFAFVVLLFAVAFLTDYLVKYYNFMTQADRRGGG